MTRELIMATAISAVWLATCFVVSGVLYITAGRLIDPSGLMQFENAMGVLQYSDGISIPRLSLVVFGSCMFLACLPINYYWLRRLKRGDDDV